MATKVQGLDKLKKKLAKLPSTVKFALRFSLNESAAELVRMQKGLAASSRDQGDLIDSIEIVPGRHDLAITVQAGGDKAPHARWVEFGVPHRPATPFFFPAYRALKKRIRARTNKAVRNAARRQASG